jgi:copper chaperone
MEETVIVVEGMKCQNCVKKITTLLESISGIEFVDVSLEKKLATIQFDSNKTSISSIIQKIQENNFKAREPLIKTIKVHGMKCTNCTNKITDSLLSNFPEILKVQVDLDEKKVNITSVDPLDETQISSNISNLGFQVITTTQVDQPKEPLEVKKEFVIPVHEVSFVNLKFFQIENTLFILKIQEKLEKLSGVLNVEMNSQDSSAYIEYNPEKITPDGMISHLENYGYTSKVQDLKTESLSVNIGGEKFLY